MIDHYVGYPSFRHCQGVAAGDELEQEKAKKQKIDDDQEEAEMRNLIKIVPDEEDVVIDAIPLATKPLISVD
ncbi:hypothetical protein Tco_0075262 [Tanacetum coccineum]